MSDSQILTNTHCGSVSFACSATLWRNWAVSWCLQLRLTTGLPVYLRDIALFRMRVIWFFLPFLKWHFLTTITRHLFSGPDHREGGRETVYGSELFTIIMHPCVTSNGFCDKHRYQFSRVRSTAWFWSCLSFAFIRCMIQQCTCEAQRMHLTHGRNTHHSSFPET